MRAKIFFTGGVMMMAMVGTLRAQLPADPAAGPAAQSMFSGQEGRLFSLEFQPAGRNLKFKVVEKPVAEVKARHDSVEVSYGMGSARKVLRVRPNGDHYVVEGPLPAHEALNIKVSPKSGGEPEVFQVSPK